jgi:uncharacterized surface protein with fasciclin (FAS1) repeats
MFRILKNTVFILSLIVFTTCINDDYDKNYTTFEEDQIASYLEKNPELYSEFYALLQKTGIVDLLNAYGTYTCFAPTNEAVKKYYAEKNTSFEQLTDKEAKEIVYNHLFLRKLKSTEFPFGAISFANMDGRYLYISFGKEDNSLTIYINETVRILALDQTMHNGIIHTVDGVIIPSHYRLPDVIAKLERYSLFSEALVATGLSDSLLLFEDDTYEEKWGLMHQSGYTAFVESDSLYAVNGIRNLEDLKNYAANIYDKMYPTDKNVSDISDRRNSLNRFVAYHLLDRMQAENEFIGETKQYFFIPGTIVYEYIETMSPNTLLEVQTGTLFNKKKDGTAIRIVRANIIAENGLCHEIDKILVYDETLENDVLNKRLRMSVSSMYPELTSNKMRYTSGIEGVGSGTWRSFQIPDGYLKGLTFTESSALHFSSCNCFMNYQGEELQAHGKWDFTLRLPPVPTGSYEIRICYIPAASLRGISQFYIDGEPCGIPSDMNFYADHPTIGWISDKDTDDNGVQNDKMMHNRGYMKGSNVQWGNSHTLIARETSGVIRKVITTKTFHKTEPHYFRVKCVMEIVPSLNAFHLNFVEFMPLSHLEKEGRD